MGPNRGRLTSRRLRLLALIGAVIAVALPTAGSAAPRLAPQPFARIKGHEPPTRVPWRVRRDTTGIAVPGQERPRTAHALPTTGPAWTFIGPRPVNDPLFGGPTGLVGGRVTSLALLPASPFDIYAGTADGGVWKSTNQGGTWIPITDKGPNLSIGSLASDTTSQAVYAGTGEDNFNSDAVPGVGILRLVNTTVTNVAPNLAGTTIGGLAVDRTTAHASLRLFAATSIGLYQSTGGGPGTWKPNANFAGVVANNFLPDHATGVIQDLTASAKFFATVGDACRGNSTAAILRSVNHGANWNPVLTISSAGRVAVATGPNNTEYAIAAQCNGNIWNVWKSTSGGAAGSWHPIPAQFPYDPFNPGGGSNGQGTYDIAIGVDPTNANNFVIEGVDAFASLDGGASLHVVAPGYTGGVIHPDFHAVLFTGANSFYVGNDGGVWSTTDMGGSGTTADWTDLNSTFATTQFYTGSALDSNNVLGGAQDNGNSGFFGGPTTTWNKYTIAGDGFYTAIDYTAGSTKLYDEFFNLGLIQGDTTNKATSNYISPCNNPSATPPIQNCASAAFGAPFVLDPSNPLRLLAGSRALYESKDSQGNYTGGGPNGTPTDWTRLAPDLTYDTAHPFLFNYNDTISSISVAPKGESNVIYTLSAQGKVFRTLDDQTFTDITSNLPPANALTATGGWAWGSSIAVNPWNTDEAWVGITGSQVGHVWHTVDGGFSWHDITGNLGDIPVTSVLPDPREKNTIFIGTANGVYVCGTCGGGAAIGLWQHYGTGLPPVWIGTLAMTRDTKELIAFTHGRSAWEIPTALLLGTQLVTQFPTSGATEGIANGPNGVWFTEGNKVGVAAIDGTVTEYTIPGASTLQDITLGPDGNMWFTDSGANFFGSISPNGQTIHTYPTLQAGGHPRGIAAGPDGNLYICDPGNNEIYVESTAGAELNRQHVPTTGASPYEIVNGGDGYLYFTEFTAANTAGAGQIGVITPSPYSVTELTLPNNTIGPLGIGLGPDGHVWYTEWGNGHVGELTGSGPINSAHEFNVGAVHHTPSGLTTGYDRNLWLAMQGLSTLERFNTQTQTVTSYTLPTPAYEVITGPDGNLWYTTQTGELGRLELSLS